MELMASPVFLSIQRLRKLDVGISMLNQCFIMCNHYISGSMIRKDEEDQQRIYCDNCSRSLFDRLGTQFSCIQCEYANDQIEIELQFVPKAYQSNAKNRRQLDRDRRLNGQIKQFLSKYGIQSQLQQLKQLREKLIRIKEMTPNSKGTREAAAVVVYWALKQEIKLSIADFCKLNNLKHKSFNRKYKVYNKLYNQKQEIVSLQGPVQKETTQFIKMQEKINTFEEEQESINGNRMENQQEQQSNKLFYITFADSRKGIQVIFDDIFPKFYLKEKKQLIIQKLVTRVTSVSAHFFSQIQTQSLSKPIQLYYLIFAILKALRYKINFEKYNNIIRKNAGYQLRKSLVYQVKKHYDEIYKRDRDAQSESFELIKLSDIKIQDNNSEILRIRFPLADSGDEFDYQYYYEDPFYD